MRRVLVDANVIVRFLVADHAVHFEHAACLMRQAEEGEVRLVLLDAVVAELAYVLTSVFSKNRASTADALRAIVSHPGVETPGAAVLLDALSRFASTRVDFIDCYLAAHAAEATLEVATFDNDFRKFNDVRLCVFR